MTIDWNTIPLVATGDDFTAAQFNSWVKENLDELKRVAETSMIAAVQAASSGAWINSGTVNSYPSKAIIQIGNCPLAFTASTTAETTVTFPIPFSSYPLVFSEIYDNSSPNNVTLSCSGFGGSGGGAYVKINGKATSSITATYKIAWIAIGMVL